MNAPILWQQLLIAFIAFVSLPAVIALLVKLRVFPLVAFLLIVHSFEGWAQTNETLCLWLFVAFIAYPVLVWGFKLFRWWHEEQQCKQAMLSSAIPWYAVSLRQDQ